MKEIIERLHENRQIELAKEILESNGYQVEKNPKESTTATIFNESLDEFPKVFREFTKEDYLGYAGAEKLPGGGKPFIASLDDTDIILSGSDTDDRTFTVSMNSYDDSSDEDIGYFVDLRSLSLAKRVAIDAYSMLKSGSSVKDVASDLGFESFF